jgi:hypothetical protein
LYTLTESFGNFKNVGSLTLPHSYMLNYTIPAAAGVVMFAGQLTNFGSGCLARWTINAQEIVVDTPNIPQDLFKAE